MTNSVTLTATNGVTCNKALQIRLKDEEAERIALMFKAISHPIRLQMLDLIGQGDGELCGCDIECHFDLTQPTISHHLKVLRDAGLITSEGRGVWVHHRIHTDNLKQAQAILTTLRS